MTYLKFHVIFNIPLLVILSALNFLIAPWSPGELFAMVILIGIVMIFTTPWDNLAAKWGIWGFPKDRVAAWLWHLPVEEYAFFFLQTMNVILLTRWSLREFGLMTGVVAPLEEINLGLMGGFLAVWLVCGIVLFRLRRPTTSHYAVHLLFWFAPVVAFQWLLVPQVLAAHAVLIVAITLVAGTYYTIADLVAVKAGTWYFDESQITGFKLWKILPWEEAAFFYLTSWLVCQSFLMLLPAAAR